MPGGTPVKKTPAIRDIIETSAASAPSATQTTITTTTATAQHNTTAAPAAIEETAPDLPSDKVHTPTANAEPTESPTTTQEPTATPPPEPKNTPEQFESLWKQLFEDLLKKTPMLYFPLSDTIPTYKDKIIHIQVINDFLKNELEQKKRAILEYWHQHFDLALEDIQITVNKDMEIKKIIYTADDKLKNMEEQNPQLRDFLNIINFKIKD